MKPNNNNIIIEDVISLKTDLNPKLLNNNTEQEKANYTNIEYKTEYEK